MIRMSQKSKQAAYMREYRAKNREKSRAYMRDYMRNRRAEAVKKALLTKRKEGGSATDENP